MPIAVPNGIAKMWNLLDNDCRMPHALLSD
jgi:hypothetical protein